MALTQAVTVTSSLGQDVVFSNAYITVDEVRATKHGADAYVVTRDEKGGRLLAQANLQFVPDLGGGNFLMQAYQALKAVPEFAAAQDC